MEKAGVSEEDANEKASYYTGMMIKDYQAIRDNGADVSFDDVKDKFYKLNKIINYDVPETSEQEKEEIWKEIAREKAERTERYAQEKHKWFSKDYGFNPDTYFEQPEVIENIQKSKKNFSEALDDIAWGQDKTGKKPVVLFKPTKIWTMVGLPDRKISFDKSKIRKVIKEHGLTIDDLKGLPEKLANPEFIFESATDDTAYVGVLDRNNEPFVAVVKPVGSDLKVTNIIKSAYNKDNGFVSREINAGHLLYDKTKPTEFRPHRALIAQGIPQSDSNNINQENENVKQIDEQHKFYSKDYVSTPDELNSQTNERVIGAYNDLTREIELFKGQNPSTLMHELSHHFMYNHLMLMESMGLKDRNAPVFEWLSKKAGREINSVAEMEDADHENLVEAFIAYMNLGEAPNLATQNIFKRAKEWLLDMYSIHRTEARIIYKKIIDTHTQKNYTKDIQIVLCLIINKLL